MAAGMNRATLRMYLENGPMIQAIRQKQEIKNIKDALHEARKTMHDVGINEAALAAIDDKIGEYGKIKRNYSVLIEDTWGITWQDESIIAKYIDHDPDELPEFARF